MWVEVYEPRDPDEFFSFFAGISAPFRAQQISWSMKCANVDGSWIYPDGSAQLKDFPAFRFQVTCVVVERYSVLAEKGPRVYIFVIWSMDLRAYNLFTQLNFSKE